MLKIKGLTVRNFLSVGNVAQSINLCNQDIVLILGENLDMGGNDYRNGVGKTTIINALSYALYGKTISKIKLGNIINNVNKKGLSVSIEFENNGNTYYIERNKKPDKLVFKINGNASIEETEDNEAQGSNSQTQQEIERAIGINHLMFANIVALNTYVEPFLKLSGPMQREFIEELLGITKLSEKASILSKIHIKDTKDFITKEEARIKSIQDSNTKITNNINLLKNKESQWVTDKERKLVELSNHIEWLASIDVERELESHRLVATIREKEKDRNNLVSLERTTVSSINDINKRIDNIERQLTTVVDKKCPKCDQNIPDHKHASIQEELVEEFKDLSIRLEQKNKELLDIRNNLSIIGEIQKKPELKYQDVNSVYDLKTKIATAESELLTIYNSNNPYTDQISTLSSSIEEISYDTLIEYQTLLEHQEFLLKLLTNKDSFIRKKIINQNLSFLNTRLDYYLNKINLPHSVRFLPDLDVEILEHGIDMDFDNLSKGERTRLSLSLCLAFRDVYESLNGKIDLLFVDEFIDNGLDPSGVDSCLSVLKSIVREQSKSVFLITHRDELIGRIDNIITVVKESGFTMFSQ